MCQGDFGWGNNEISVASMMLISVTVNSRVITPAASFCPSSSKIKIFLISKIKMICPLSHFLNSIMVYVPRVCTVKVLDRLDWPVLTFCGLTEVPEDNLSAVCGFYLTFQ